MPLIREPGAVVAGRYILESLLGEGGFGRVWRAQDPREKRVVAFKELLVRAEGTESKESQLQLESEFYWLSRLKHRSIVQVYDYGALDAQTRYLVMELVEGEDLAQHVTRGPLEPTLVGKVLVELCQALQLLHARLLLHCDIKSENVRLTPRGDVKLMDFGLLHQLGTPAQGVRGTLHAMAPEVIRGGVLDARTDLYAVGVLGYELLTGQLPFQGQSASELLDQHLNEAPPRPSDLLDVPPALEAVLLKLLAKEQRARFDSAAQVAQALVEGLGLSSAVESTAHRVSYLYSVELIGRDSELELLHQSRTALKQGRGNAVLLTGSGGEGKSRLLRELALSARLEQVVWSEGACRKEGQAPLGPMVQALGALLERTPEECLSRHGAVLSSLLPQLEARGFEPPQFQSGDQARAKLSEAVVGWLRELSERFPFILCVEDLHWAQAETVELFNFIIRGLHDRPVMLVGTYRQAEVERTNLLWATADEGLALVLQLRPLRRRDVDPLLNALLGRHTLPALFVDRLHERTQGNSMFLIETLRYLIESNLLRYEDPTWTLANDTGELPHTIAEVVKLRLSLLEPALRGFVMALAPVGLSVPLEVAGAVTGKENDALFDGFLALAERQFLERLGDGWSFIHETVREGVYAQVPEDERRAHHRAIGESLELSGRAQLELLAHHFLRADDLPRATKYHLAAGRAAVARQQMRAATELLRQSVSLLERGGGDDDQLLQAYDALATASFNGHPPTCVQTVDKLLARWEPLVDVEQVKARLLKQADAKPGLTGLIRRALGPKGPPPFDPTTKDPVPLFQRMLQLRSMQALCLAAMGNTDLAIDRIDSVLVDAPASLGPTRFVALNAKCSALFVQGRLDEMLQVSDEAARGFESFQERLTPQHHWFLGTAHYFHALGHAGLGRSPPQERVAAALAVADRQDLPELHAFARLPALFHAVFSGRPEAFRSVYETLQGILRRLGQPRLFESRLFSWVPYFYVMRGELELAHAACEKLDAVVRLLGDKQLRCFNDTWLGMVALQEAKLDVAEERLAAAVQSARENRFGRLTMALCAQSELRWMQGRADEARTLAGEALDRARAESTRSPHDEVWARLRLGTATPGEPGALELRTGEALARELDNPLQLTAVLCARAQRQAGGQAERAALLEEALQQATRIANPLWTRRVEELRPQEELTTASGGVA